MKVLVTGAGGQLGHDAAEAAAAANHEVTALTHAELDLTEFSQVGAMLEAEAPNAVINCAAYTKVDDAEDDPGAAFAVNAEGTANLAEITGRQGCKLVHCSTDYVFDGKKATPYIESDEVNPLSIYGRSKLAGELEVARLNRDHFIVRSSWLFGVHGPNFVETMLTLAASSGEVLVVNDQIGCPTYTGHLAQALVQLLDTTAYGIHHIAGWGECSWYDFAVEIFKQAKAECKVMAATSQMLKRKAERPSYSSLISERERPLQLPRWQEGLAAFLQARANLVTEKAEAR